MERGLYISAARSHEHLAGKPGSGCSVAIGGLERILDSTVVQEYAYVYNGSSLVQMVVQTTVDDGTPTTDTLYFSYDATGNPMSVLYNGTDYYYTVSLQGDVTAILNTSGTAVVEYTYDAWGNVTAYTAAGNSPGSTTLVYRNPIRYRGYVYDTETGLYYLQSRYYSPEIGRFINADIYAATGQGLIGNNMFAYCNNNPVIGCDPLGTCFHRLDFWNDCSNCGGETFGDKWNSFTNWCDDTYNDVKDFVTNTDETTTRNNLSKYGFSFYNGKPVLMADLPFEGSAFSFGIIVIDDYYKEEYVQDSSFSTTLNHEYGHAVHMEKVGVATYTATVAVPSLVCAGLSHVFSPVDKYYYSLPWERIADQFGGVDRTCLPGADTVATVYKILTYISAVINVY